MIEQKNKLERRYLSKEMCEILDKQKAKVNEFAWNSLKISDVEASRIVARKYRNANLD